jgi:hypothetical protein
MAEAQSPSESTCEGLSLLYSLHRLSETAPTVAKAIFNHLTRASTRALRGTNQLLRATMNRTVSTVSLAAPSRGAGTASDLRIDLGESFPNATKVNLEIGRHADGPAFLAQVVGACPRLLAGLHAMHMKLPDSFLHEPFATALPTFLSR